MRRLYPFVLGLTLLSACQNSRQPAQNNRNRRPAAPARAAPTPEPGASPTDATPSGTTATPTPATDSDASSTAGTNTGATNTAAATPDPANTGSSGATPPADTGIRVFRLGESTCARQPERARLGAGVHGFFSGDRLEMEVRNVRYSCTPVPTYEAVLEDGTMHLRVRAPDRAALTRCQCRHDQFLQVAGVPTGEYAVQVEEIAAGDAGTATVLATGRIDPTPNGPAGGAATAPTENTASGAPAAGG